MNKKHKSSLLSAALLFLMPAIMLCGQDISIGFRDSVESKLLQETRRLYISLPKDYYTSDKTYPVIYRLDGDRDLLIETAGVVHRLAYMEEVVPEVIIVAIENTNRNRDMMPVNTSFYREEPGADRFTGFIKHELLPHMQNTYRVSGERVLCAQSLSSIFALYCFLTSPDLFDSYLATSAGFPDCGSYFVNLTNERVRTKERKEKKLFISYGEKDMLDPNGVMKEQLSIFVETLASDEYINCRYKIYKEEGHVPFQSLYHGLKFIFEEREPVM